MSEWTSRFPTRMDDESHLVLMADKSVEDYGSVSSTGNLGTGLNGYNEQLKNGTVGIPSSYDIDNKTFGANKFNHIRTTIKTIQDTVFSTVVEFIKSNFLYEIMRLDNAMSSSKTALSNTISSNTVQWNSDLETKNNIVEITISTEVSEIPTKVGSNLTDTVSSSLESLLVADSNNQIKTIGNKQNNIICLDTFPSSVSTYANNSIILIDIDAETPN